VTWPVVTVAGGVIVAIVAIAAIVGIGVVLRGKAN
jgi:hypothetical protein